MKNKFFMILVTLFLTHFNFVFAVPYGYTEVNAKTGWSINKKSDFINKSYLQIIELKNNKIIFIDTDISDGMFMRYPTAQMFLNLKNIGIYSLSNGAFFEEKSDTSAGLSFPYKVDGVVKTTGWVTGKYPNQLKMLALGYNSTLKVDFAKVLPYDEKVFKSYLYPNILTGLNPNFDKGVNDKKGRTFIGVNNNPYNPTVYILNATFVTQNEAIQELLNVGVSYNDIIMFDGSGSTQLAYKTKQNLVDVIIGCLNVLGVCTPEVPPRKIPQAIAVMPRYSILKRRKYKKVEINFSTFFFLKLIILYFFIFFI